jgi:hypothetical protein
MDEIHNLTEYDEDELRDAYEFAMANSIAWPTDAPIPPPRANQVRLVNDHVVNRDAERMLRMTQVLGKFSTALSLKPVTVEVSSAPPKGGVVSWSTPNSIQLNTSAIGDVTEPETVASLKGLGLHETAHIMMTPPVAGTKFARALNNDSLMRAFNVLEDQRIETHLTTLFSNVDDWLLASTAKQLSATQTEAEYQYALLAGRKYLPPEIVQAYREQFKKPELLADVDAIINEYVGLDLASPKTHARAIELVSQFNNIIESMSDGGSEDVPDGADASQYDWLNDGWSGLSEPTMHQPGAAKDTKSASLTPKQQKDLADKVKAKIAGQPAPSSPGDDESPDGQGGVPAPKPGDEQGGNAAGQGGSLQELLDKTLKDVVSRRQKEISKTIAQFNGDVGLDGKSVPPPKRSNRQYESSVDPKTVKASKSFARELELMRADYDPGWVLRTEQGRLNVQRYGTGCDTDEAFDEWDTGREDVLDIECVIVIDNSGSMYSQMSNAYQSMWAIKRALDKVDASTTVVTFASSTHLLYSADEKATAQYRDIGSGGGTEPTQAVRYARSVLANSQRAIKLFIAITDGEWFASTDADDDIRHLRKGGVITALGMIGAGSLKDGDVTINSHGCEVAVPIEEMSQLFVLAKEMVRAGIRKNLIK